MPVPKGTVPFHGGCNGNGWPYRAVGAPIMLAAVHHPHTLAANDAGMLRRRRDESHPKAWPRGDCLLSLQDGDVYAYCGCIRPSTAHLQRGAQGPKRSKRRSFALASLQTNERLADIAASIAHDWLARYLSLRSDRLDTGCRNRLTAQPRPSPRVDVIECSKKRKEN